MKIKHIVCVAALSMLNLVAAGIAQAGEWNVTFQVPITATALSASVTSIEVGCSIKDQNGVQLGFNFVKLPITGGAYSGPNVTIPVNAKGNTNPAQWTCQVIRLFDVNNASCIPAANSTYAFCNIKTGLESGVPYNITGVSGKF